MHVLEEKWKKSFQFGKRSCSNMPFHYIVPSPSTTLVTILEVLPEILRHLGFGDPF